MSLKEQRKVNRGDRIDKAPNRKALRRDIQAAKEATASLGKFQPSMKNEKPKKNAKNPKNFESNFGNLEKESVKMDDMIKMVKKNKKQAPIDSAANKLIKFEKDRSNNKSKRGKR